jgi:hypothetical protein
MQRVYAKVEEYLKLIYQSSSLSKFSLVIFFFFLSLAIKLPYYGPPLGASVLSIVPD